MDLYIVSQIFAVISYALLASTYVLKSRRLILLVNFGFLAAGTASFICLSAWVGVAMYVVGFIRSIIFLLQDKKNRSENIDKVDWYILVFLSLITIISGIVLYDGFFSLFSMFATLIYTVSVWQKNTKIYRALGIPVSVLWICYHVYISSLFGIVLESCLLVCVIVGLINYCVNEKRTSN